MATEQPRQRSMSEVFASGLTGTSTEVIVLKELIKSLSGVKFDGTMMSIIHTAVRCLGRVVGIFVIQHLARNPGKIISLFKSLLVFLFYKKLSVRYGTNTKEGLISVQLRGIFNNSKKEDGVSEVSYNMFPIFMSSDNSHDHVSYMPWVHSSVVQEKVDIGTSKYEETERVNNSKEVKTNLRNLGCPSRNPKVMYPSNNYKLLAKMVKSFFDTISLIGNTPTTAIIVNGKPGLGKSDSIEYLASLNIVPDIIKIDMTSNMDRDFKQVVERLSSSTKAVYLFDELDKHIEYRIQEAWDSYQNKNGNKIPYADFYAREKMRFFNDLLELLERNRFEQGALLIFCSNNFDTIFKGVDMTHFYSLRSRFKNITFHSCDAAEFKDYMRYINNKFEGSEYYHDNLEELLLNVRDDLSLTFRKLGQLFLESCHHIPTLIDLCNKEMDAPMLTPCTGNIHTLDADKDSSLGDDREMTPPPLTSTSDYTMEDTGCSTSPTLTSTSDYTMKDAGCSTSPPLASTSDYTMKDTGCRTPPLSRREEKESVCVCCANGHNTETICGCVYCIPCSYCDDPYHCRRDCLEFDDAMNREAACKCCGGDHPIDECQCDLCTHVCELCGRDIKEEVCPDCCCECCGSTEHKMDDCLCIKCASCRCCITNDHTQEECVCIKCARCPCCNEKGHTDIECDCDECLGKPTCIPDVYRRDVKIPQCKHGQGYNCEICIPVRRVSFLLDKVETVYSKSEKVMIVIDLMYCFNTPYYDSLLDNKKFCSVLVKKIAQLREEKNKVNTDKVKKRLEELDKVLDVVESKTNLYINKE